MHQAKGTDYLSRVAWLAGIPLDRFMLDNTEAVKDLDAPLAGVNLLLCGPAPGEGGSEGPKGGGYSREPFVNFKLQQCFVEAAGNLLSSHWVYCKSELSAEHAVALQKVL
jgi:hypothetical protein